VHKLSPVLLAVAVALATPAATASVAVADDSGHRPGATVAKKRHCDRNYRGRCLRPHVSDYDCAGGSGNGPYYVSGPFRVVGYDHYGLDSDHDGIACES
jgi:hypothetical protein